MATEPGWIDDLPSLLYHIETCPDGILKASVLPNSAYDHTILDEGVEIWFPHKSSWMILPATLIVGDALDKLQNFYSLLSESSIV